MWWNTGNWHSIPMALPSIVGIFSNDFAHTHTVWPSDSTVLFCDSMDLNTHVHMIILFYKYSCLLMVKCIHFNSRCPFQYFRINYKVHWLLISIAFRFFVVLGSFALSLFLCVSSPLPSQIFYDVHILDEQQLVLYRIWHKLAISEPNNFIYQLIESN